MLDKVNALIDLVFTGEEYENASFGILSVRYVNLNAERGLLT